MLHPFHFFLDSLCLFMLKQPEMQIGSDVYAQRKRVVRLNTKQL
jgi:hypothetical protein